MRRVLSKMALGTALLWLLAPCVARAEETEPLSKLDLSNAVQGFGRPQAGRSVDNHPLTLHGQTFTDGFGTHSPGILIIDLKGGTRRFTAIVGIDDEVGSKGSANFEVLGDGHKLVWQSGVMRGGQTPKTVDLDLTGVQQIVLRVTTAGDGYEFDHADWADARFVVTGARPQTVAWKATVMEPAIAMPTPTPAPQLHPPTVVSVYTGTPLLWTPPVTGDRPLKFSARGLPMGLTLNAATGTITGTVVKEGDYPVQVSVQNGKGRDTRTIHLRAGAVVAATPPMGWNSYDCYGDSVTEEETLANARYVASHLLPYGWDTVVVDYRWYDAFAHDNNASNKPFAPLTMDATGRLVPAANRFPSAADGHGFKALADKIHALGLKFGIHIMRGIPRNAVKANTPIDGSAYTATEAANTQDTCPWCPDMYGVRGATPAGQAYYDSLFRLYASWGVDIVKMDDTSAPYHTDEIEAVHSAIGKCGRSIVYSLSPGETPLEDGKHVATHANMWRGLGDLWDNWNQLNHEFEVGARWPAFVGPGHWPDPDMLPLGRLSVGNRSVGNDRRSQLTRPEQMTLLSLWSLLPAPLMVGADLPANDPWTLALLTNADVLAVDQDALGAPGKPIFTKDEWQVWSKPMADGSHAIGLFNRSDFDETLTVTATDLGLTGTCTYRDLWQRKDLGRFPGTLTLIVPSHGVALYRFQPTQRSASK
ncbi:MAG: alpha-galactosidase [Chthonomonadaceae bacterium]|nr:alpha-galactosidase [Chthonomonadaceae bacterium]